MTERNRKPPPPEAARPDEVGLEDQPMPEQFQSLDAEDVDERWERPKGLPEEEDDNYPPTSEEALPDEREEKLIQRDLLGEDGARPDDK